MVEASAPTISELFALAIAGERVSEQMYRGLEKMFAHCPEVAEFWRMYADEENEHALNLQRIWRASAAETLARPADPHMVELARRVSNLPMERVLASVMTLEDAYQMVHEAETNEWNSVFEFLIEECSQDLNAQQFLRSQMGSHITHITERFPEAYQSQAARQQVHVMG